MTKQTKKYEDMNNEEKAQAIYNKLVQDQDTTTLAVLLLNLSDEYRDDDRVFTVEDWLEYFRESPSDLDTLVMIAQKSKDLNITDEYIRESIYYYGYKTSDDILELVDEDEAVEWITMALDGNSPYIEDLDVELCKN